jgi:pilus assembly protein CpaD
MFRRQLANAGRQAAALARLGFVFGGLGVALAGCESMQNEPGPIWSDYRLRHPIALVEKNRKLEIFVGGERNGLTPKQRAEVLAYAQTWREEGTGRFVIEHPVNARNGRAAAIALGEVRSILAASGIPAGAVKVQSYRAPAKNMLAVITINYPQLAAQAGPCGLWPDDLGVSADRKHFDNVQYWNFGCATQRNLAAMVANPADLVQPRAEDSIYSARRSTVLDKYRKGESPATTYPDANKGAISDLGK